MKCRHCDHEYPDALGRHGCPNCEDDMRYKIVDAATDEVLERGLTLDEAEDIMISSKRYPHAMKALEVDDEGS